MKNTLCMVITCASAMVSLQSFGSAPSELELRAQKVERKKNELDACRTRVESARNTGCYRSFIDSYTSLSELKSELRIVELEYALEKSKEENKKLLTNKSK